MRAANDCNIKTKGHSKSVPDIQALPCIQVASLSVAQHDPASPLIWWRTRAPTEFSGRDNTILRWALLQNRMIDEPYWSDAVVGKVTAAINIAVRCLKTRPIDHPDVDLALSAMLACALDSDVTSGILISSALRRRVKIDPSCRLLSDLWLIADF